MPPLPQISQIPVPTSISGASPSVVKSSAKLYLGSNVSIENTYDKGFNTNNLQISTNSLVNCYALNTQHATIDGLGNFVSNGTMSIDGALSVGGALNITGVTNFGSNLNVTGKIDATSSVSGSSFIVKGVADLITGIVPAVHIIDGVGNQTSMGDSTISGIMKALSFTNTSGSFVASSVGDITCNSIISLNKVDIGTLNQCTIISNVGDISSTKSLSIGNGTLLGYADPLVVTNNYAFTVETNGALKAANGLFAVDVSGNVVTNGALKAANGLFAVDVSGNLDTSGFLKVGTNNALTVDINGNLDTSGHLYTTQDLSVGTNNAFTVSSSGVVAAAGSVSMGQDLSVGTNGAFTVSSSGVVATTGSVSMGQNLSVASGLFTVDTSGNVAANGTLKVGPNSGLFNIDSSGNMTSSSGKLSLNDYATTSYAGYTSNIQPANITKPASTKSGAFVAAVDGTILTNFTSQQSSTYLTTQSYVDKLVYDYAITPLNAILGSDASVLDSFAAMTDFLKNTEGVATVTNIQNANNGLIAGQTKIQTTVMQLANQAINTVPVLCSPNVWADECMPLPIPKLINLSNSLDGWWFSNSLVASSKINWYLPANNTCINGVMTPFTLAQLQLLYINFTAFNTNSGSAPWIDIFTVSKNNSTTKTDIYPGIVNAKIQLLFNNIPANTSSTGTNYCLYAGATANTLPANVFNSNLISVSSIRVLNITNATIPQATTYYTLNDVFNNNSIVASTDPIAGFAIETNSIDASGNINFILHSLGLMGYSGVNVTETCGTTIFSFSNNGPATNYMYNTFLQKHSDMSPIVNSILNPVKNVNQLAAYTTTYNQ